MSEKPLAEAYEKLKELRRRGGSESEIQSRVGSQLHALYDSVTSTGVPDRFADLIRKLDAAEVVSAASSKSTNLFRVLEIRTLADRVFGDEKKAEAWLQRPSAVLSGQKPIDLLKDELGAAVVRETLEQIDSGIFA
jgi:putative toxin-antitoxin system antitoxin component (TIGR02293 family)